MSLADEIRNSFKLPNDFFEKEIIPCLKASGRYAIICDTHIREIRRGAIPYKYGNSFREWARENGFKVYDSHNSYGVKLIVVEI